MGKILKGIGAFGLGFASGMANMKPEERAAKMKRIRSMFGWKEPAVKTEISDWGKGPDVSFSDAWSESTPAAANDAPPLPGADAVETFPVAAVAAPEVKPIDEPSVETFFDEAVKEG